MAGMALRETGIVLLTILKGILQLALYLLRVMLAALKAALLLFSLVLRICLSVLGAPIKRG